jgi:hypothetical protein
MPAHESSQALSAQNERSYDGLEARRSRVLLAGAGPSKIAACSAPGAHSGRAYSTNLHGVDSAAAFALQEREHRALFRTQR